MYADAAVAPTQGQMISLMLPEASTAMLNLFLEQVGQTFSQYFIIMQGGSCRLASRQGPGRPGEYPLDPATCLQSRAESG